MSNNHANFLANYCSGDIMKRLTSLIEFIAVVNNGGFSAAAESLGVSTSYVSRRVASLEAHLGVQLLHRTTRRVNLTKIGAHYYEKTVAIISALDTLEDDLVNQQNNVIGEINVSAGGIFGEDSVALSLIDFALEYPEIKINLNISTRQVDLSAEGYDLAIRHGSPGDPDLISRKLTTRRMIVCASPSYFDQFGRPNNPEDLQQHACLQSSEFPWSFQDNNQIYNIKVEGRWTSNNGAALANAALQGLGVVRLAEMYVQSAIDEGLLEITLEDFEIPPTTTYLVYPTRKYLPFRLRILIDFLVERFK
ncbi:MAG: LysR family transcriptional regulator [Sneathiella sp.]